MSLPFTKRWASPPKMLVAVRVVGSGSAVYSPTSGAAGRLKSGPTAQPTMGNMARDATKGGRRDRQIRRIRLIFGVTAGGRGGEHRIVCESFRNRQGQVVQVSRERETQLVSRARSTR